MTPDQHQNMLSKAMPPSSAKAYDDIHQ